LAASAVGGACWRAYGGRVPDGRCRTSTRQSAEGAPQFGSWAYGGACRTAAGVRELAKVQRARRSLAVGRTAGGWSSALPYHNAATLQGPDAQAVTSPDSLRRATSHARAPRRHAGKPAIRSRRDPRAASCSCTAEASDRNCACNASSRAARTRAHRAALGAAGSRPLRRASGNAPRSPAVPPAAPPTSPAGPAAYTARGTGLRARWSRRLRHCGRRGSCSTFRRSPARARGTGRCRGSRPREAPSAR
jgi:hypothetical protein